MNNKIILQNKEKDLSLCIEELAFKLIKLDEKITKVEGLVDNIISYILKSPNDRYQSGPEKLEELEEFHKIGGTD